MRLPFILSEINVPNSDTKALVEGVVVAEVELEEAEEEVVVEGEEVVVPTALGREA
jgi:hypothetical protein